MARRRRGAAAAPAGAASTRRFTVDASVFVNAFNPHETGHAASLEFLAAVQREAIPVIVPALAPIEIAAAVARAADAIYVAVARRYGTMLVSRDREQRARGAEAVECRTPETAFR